MLTWGGIVGVNEVETDCPTTTHTNGGVQAGEATGGSSWQQRVLIG